MKEAVLEPNESKKSKAGTERATSVGKTESNIASQSMQQTVLAFTFCICMQQREAIRQERCVTGMIQNLRGTQCTHRQLRSCIKYISANSKEVSSKDFHTAKFNTVLYPWQCALVSGVGTGDVPRAYVVIPIFQDQ